MSEEKVELVRRVYAALTRGNADTLRGLAVPEFVVDFSRRHFGDDRAAVLEAAGLSE